MPRFHYSAYDASGTLVSGQITVENRQMALKALAQGAKVPVDLQEASDGTALPWWQREIGGRRQLSTKALAHFTRELSSLIGANLPIDEAMRIIAVQHSLSRRFRRRVEDLLDRITQGYSLSAALEADDGAFPEYYIRLVSAGEFSGSLDTVLGDLAQTLEQAAERQSKVTSQLLYPAILVAAAVVAIAIILTVLVPAITPLFEDAQVAPPLFIQVLVTLQTFIGRYTGLILLAVCGLAVLLVVLWQSARWRLAFDRARINVPVAGPLIRHSQTARLTRLMSSLLKNGVPLTETIRVSRGVVTNRYLAAVVDDIGRQLQQGASFSTLLAQSNAFPDLFPRLARVGEETGQLDAMLAKVADTYERAVQHRVERMMTMLTPMLTLFIGVFVGALVVSVMNAILAANALVFQ